jgi:phosphate-selective porin OprO and OprP
LPPGEKERVAHRKVNADGIGFKPGEGVKITSDDKAFSIGLGFRFQLLYTLLNDDQKVKPEPVTDQSIQIRRARVQIGGNAFGEHNKYKLELAVSPTDVDYDKATTTSPLLEAYAEFDYVKDLTIRAGQYKVPYDRIRVISDFGRQLVDYSTATREFSLDRDLGVEVKSNDLFGAGLFRYHLGVFSGKGRNSFYSPNLGLLYVGRIEALPLGMFEDYMESDLQRTRPRLSIGVGAARLVGGLKDKGTTGDPPTDGGVVDPNKVTDFNMVTADAFFKIYGFSALAALYYRTGERFTYVNEATGVPLNPPDPSRDGIGFALQAGYLVPRTPFEIAARYMTVKGKDEPGHNGLKDTNEIGGGLNYFFAQHHFKLQTDFFRVWAKEVSDGYNQFRLQMQLAI